MQAVTSLAIYRKANIARLAKEIVKGIPAGLVISLNAWGKSFVSRNLFLHFSVFA